MISYKFDHILREKHPKTTSFKLIYIYMTIFIGSLPDSTQIKILECKIEIRVRAIWGGQGLHTNK